MQRNGLHLPLRRDLFSQRAIAQVYNDTQRIGVETILAPKDAIDLHQRVYDRRAIKWRESVATSAWKRMARDHSDSRIKQHSPGGSRRVPGCTTKWLTHRWSVGSEDVIKASNGLAF